MQRRATAQIRIRALGPARMVLAVAVAQGGRASERLEIQQGGVRIPFIELTDTYGTRLHEADIDAGEVDIDYEVAVEGLAPRTDSGDLEMLTFLRQSRYCESDVLHERAHQLFDGVEGHELLRAVRDWTATSIRYEHGSTSTEDGALAVLEAGRGACRDFAHVMIAMLRARDVPARYVSVYAPELNPMDFHAVVEAFVGGEWVVIDPTGLAPRHSFLRIATGRDAADAAFMTTIGGPIEMISVVVTASVTDAPFDDHAEPLPLR
jgi:transglutaminase-like putative cysteine protease